MKKLIALSVVAVSMSGFVSAEADFRSVAKAVVVAQDEELQAQAKKSVQQIVGAVDDFMSLATRKISENSNAQDKAQLKEMLTLLETLLDKYKVAFEVNDPSVLDPQTQQECAQLIQLIAMRCMPLMAVLAENKSLQEDNVLTKAVRAELFVAVQKMVTQINKSL